MKKVLDKVRTKMEKKEQNNIDHNAMKISKMQISFSHKLNQIYTKKKKNPDN